MEPTLPLDGPARDFWDRHASHLIAAGVLTERDRDSFTVLCVTFGKVASLAEVATGADYFREQIQFNNALKQYQAYARQFGLMPQSRKQSKMDVAPAPTKDEFGL